MRSTSEDLRKVIQIMKSLPITYNDIKDTFQLINNELWRIDRYNPASLKKVNNVNNCKGYCSVKYKGKTYLYHRIAYCLYNKKDVDPNLDIDHIDGNRLNNDLKNLRLVSNRKNSNNRNVKQANGQNPFSGVYKHGKGWQAKVIILVGDKESVIYKSFPTPEEAFIFWLVQKSLLISCDGFDLLKTCEYNNFDFDLWIDTYPKTHLFAIEYKATKKGFTYVYDL